MDNRGQIKKINQNKNAFFYDNITVGGTDQAR